MAEQRTTGPTRRAVILPRSPRGARGVCFEAPDAVELVWVECPYEAAAEVIAGDVCALVVDLGAIVPRHRRLLELAYDRGIEVLGYGTLPAGLTCSDLAGVRLMGTEQLGRELARCAGLEQTARASERREASPPTVTPTGEKETLEESHAEAEETARPEEGAGEEPASADRSDRPEDTAAPDATAPARNDQAPGPRISPSPSPEATGAGELDREPGTAPAVNPANLLTPEELAALLED